MASKANGPTQSSVVVALSGGRYTSLSSVGSAGVADVIGHASLVVTQTALESLEARVGDVSRQAKEDES